MAGLPAVSTTPQAVHDQLVQYGVSPDDAQVAATAWGAATAGVSTVNSVVQGRTDAASLTPLLATAATAAAGPIAGAVVAGGVPIAGGILSAIFGGGGGVCPGWTVGTVCFPGPRPEGPRLKNGAPDPAWSSFASFDDSGGDPARARPNGRDATGRLLGVYPDNVQSRVGAAFPYYFLVLCDERAFAQSSDADLASYFQIDVATVPALRDFVRTYFALWRANAEYAINGFAASNPHLLLGALQQAWNASHSGNLTITIPRKGGESDTLCYGGTYLELLLGGAVDNQTDDLTFNAGPVTLDPVVLGNNLHLILQGGGGIVPKSSPAKTVAVTVAGGTALAALAAFVYAYAKGQAFDTVVKHAWGWITGKKGSNR